MKKLPKDMTVEELEAEAKRQHKMYCQDPYGWPGPHQSANREVERNLEVLNKEIERRGAEPCL